MIWETPPTTQALSATGSVQRRKVGSAGAGFRPPTAGSLRPTSCGGVINGPPDASCQRGRHFVGRRSVRAMFARNAALLVAASWGWWNQWKFRRVLPQDSPHDRTVALRAVDCVMGNGDLRTHPRSPRSVRPERWGAGGVLRRHAKPGTVRPGQQATHGLASWPAGDRGGPPVIRAGSDGA